MTFFTGLFSNFESPLVKYNFFFKNTVSTSILLPLCCQERSSELRDRNIADVNPKILNYYNDIHEKEWIIVQFYFTCKSS
ncbi:MAG: hypothetical protein A7316_09905 [Candidatus Altiarchaeales archaeon WOR_SM1_86-2]|nr:MAG: hypothetical protein A7316_09905 [Candidatus Altiarchaeales archaeon WOR_SM1_86-2]ODS37316.1 MAG: hypothetical protein A7315_04145 [Candidatus Altiarchaeales archaeon WOR_SM1_79]